jgi:hypothetical protein
MVWKRIASFLKGYIKGAPASWPPTVGWLAAADNPWGVPVLDVRPVTLHMLATSSDQECAENAISFVQDDGTSFIGAEPPVARTAKASLRFRIDRMLADGALFIPSEMEHKWAIFYHQGQILCVRSWLRQTQAVAEVKVEDDHIEIISVRGTLAADDEEPTLTARVLDYLLRSHALDIVYPAPLPAGMEKDPRRAAMWCMSRYGNRAWFATPHEVAAPPPEQPLRTYSLLHIAVARGDVAAIKTLLDAGVPVDLLACNGFAPLHLSLVHDNVAVSSLLLERGSSVDVRSTEGATPLMCAVELGSAEKVTFLLDHAAEPNAADKRGFTALHRAAEMGHLELVRILLQRGATPHPEAQGQTPRSLAKARSQASIVKLLDGRNPHG